jgi:glutamate synthase (NADPH/NADH) large chain
MRAAEPPIDGDSRPQADREGHAGAREQEAGRIEIEIKNVDRSAGAMLSGEVAKRYGHAGPAGRHHPRSSSAGTAGQSFGAFLAHGVTST